MRRPTNMGVSAQQRRCDRGGENAWKSPGTALICLLASLLTLVANNILARNKWDRPGSSCLWGTLDALRTFWER